MSTPESKILLKKPLLNSWVSKSDLLDKALVRYPSKWPCKAICGHVTSGDALNLEQTFADLLFHMVIVDIDVFGTLVMTL